MTMSKRNYTLHGLNMERCNNALMYTNRMRPRREGNCVRRSQQYGKHRIYYVCLCRPIYIYETIVSVQSLYKPLIERLLETMIIATKSLHVCLSVRPSCYQPGWLYRLNRFSTSATTSIRGSVWTLSAHSASLTARLNRHRLRMRSTAAQPHTGLHLARGSAGTVNLEIWLESSCVRCPMRWRVLEHVTSWG